MFHREEVFVVAPLFALLDFVNLFQWDHSQRVLFLERKERQRQRERHRQKQRERER